MAARWRAAVDCWPWNGWPRNSGAISASGAIRCAICAGHAVGAREQAPRNAPLVGLRPAVALRCGRALARRGCHSSLGYEPYDVCLCRLAQSPVTGLISMDWGVRWPLARSVSLVSSRTAASGLQIGVQDRLLTCGFPTLPFGASRTPACRSSRHRWLTRTRAGQAESPARRTGPAASCRYTWLAAGSAA